MDERKIMIFYALLMQSEGIEEAYKDFFKELEVENGFIVEKEILDDAEKEYLSAVIKPFRNKIVSISKEKCCNEGYFINVELENDVLIFPDFKNETMYEGMELEKQYTLKELGLDE